MFEAVKDTLLNTPTAHYTVYRLKMDSLTTYSLIINWKKKLILPPPAPTRKKILVEKHHGLPNFLVD